MEQTEKTSFTNRVTAAFVKSRVVIIAVLLAAIVVACAVGLVIFFNNSSIEKGLTQLDQIEFKYSSLDESADTIKEDKTSILFEVTNFADSAKGVVRVRSLLLAADIAFELEKWSESRDAYLAAYEEDSKSYTAPVALYNAAICSDELNDLGTAVEYIEQSLAYDNFALAPRALFNLGRIEESRGSFDDALVAYQQLSEDYPSSTWSNLAKSREISLKAEKKVN